MTQDPDETPRPEDDRPAGRPSYGSTPPGPPPPPPPPWGPPPPPPPGYQQPQYGPPPGQQYGQPPYGQQAYGQQGQQGQPGPYGQQGQGQYGDQGQYCRQGEAGRPPYGTPPPPAPGPYGPPPGGPYGQQQGYGGTGQPLNPADEKQWALVAHIGTILVLPVVPAIIYALFKDRGPFIHEQSKEALNFGITAFFGYVLAIIVGNILDAIFWAPPLSFIVGVAIVVFAIIAAMAVNKGENYRYPLALRLTA
jgi:uncharacterized protein